MRCRLNLAASYLSMNVHFYLYKGGNSSELILNVYNIFELPPFELPPRVNSFPSKIIISEIQLKLKIYLISDKHECRKKRNGKNVTGKKVTIYIISVLVQAWKNIR